MVSFLNPFLLFCSKVLGYKGGHGISDGYEDQRKNVLYPHGRRITCKRLSPKRVYHCLHDHHPDGYRGLLENRWNGDLQHGPQLLSIKPAKGSCIPPHSAKENDQRQDGGNPLRKKSGKCCAEYAKAKVFDHPKIHPDIQDGGED